MTKRSMLLIVVGVLAFGFVGCTTTTSPIVGLGADLHEIDFSSGLNEGKDCSSRVMGIFGPFGTRSIVKAAQSAGMRASFAYHRSCLCNRAAQECDGAHAGKSIYLYL